MKARELLNALHARNVRVTASGGRLHVDAPIGVLSAAEREALSAHKAVLLELLDHVCLDCSAALPPGHLYRCGDCTRAAWWRVYGDAPMEQDPDGT
jgi:hypothetical protein